MRTLSVELEREVDAWRKRHADLLRELEEDGVTVPSYDDEPTVEPDTEPAPTSNDGSDDGELVY